MDPYDLSTVATTVLQQLSLTTRVDFVGVAGHGTPSQIYIIQQPNPKKHEGGEEQNEVELWGKTNLRFKSFKPIKIFEF